MSETYAVNDYFKENGLINEEEYFELYQRSVDDNENFWAEQAQILSIGVNRLRRSKTYRSPAMICIFVGTKTVS